MDWIALISIIVTVVGSAIGLYTIILEKRKKKKESADTESFLKTNEVLPLVNWAYQKDIDKDLLDLILKLSLVSNHAKLITSEDNDLTFESENGTNFIPKGVSIWQICTARPSDIMLEEQLLKLKDKSRSIDSINLTYVLIIPHLLKEKAKWLKKLNTEKWKEIRIYDAQDITQWLDSEFQYGSKLNI